MNRLIARFVNQPQPLAGPPEERGRRPTAVRAARRRRYVVTRAESAPCTCPDFCERDHEND